MTPIVVNPRTDQHPESPYDDGNIPMPNGPLHPDETQHGQSYGVESGQFCHDSRDTRPDPPISPPDEDSPSTMPILDLCTARVYHGGMSLIFDSIRNAAEESGKSRYRLWKETGIDQGHLSQFMRSNKGMSVENVERMADALGLEIIIRPWRKKRK